LEFKYLKKIRAAQGGPLNRGAPCHGMFGILVNPALNSAREDKPTRRGVWRGLDIYISHHRSTTSDWRYDDVRHTV